MIGEHLCNAQGTEHYGYHGRFLHYLLADDLVVVVHALVTRVEWARRLAWRNATVQTSKERAELLEKVQQDSPHLLKPVSQQDTTEIISNYVTLYFQDELDNWKAASRTAVQAIRSRSATDQLVVSGSGWHAAHTVAGFINEQMETTAHEIGSVAAFVHSLELLDVLWAVCNLMKKHCAAFEQPVQTSAKDGAREAPSAIDTNIILAATVEDVTLDHECGSKLENEALHLNIATHAMTTLRTTKDERAGINNYNAVCQDYARTGYGRQHRAKQEEGGKENIANKIARAEPEQRNTLCNAEATPMEAGVVRAIFMGLWPRQQWVGAHRQRQIRGWFTVLYTSKDQQVHVGIAERAGLKSYYLVSMDSLNAGSIEMAERGKQVVINDVSSAPIIESVLYPEDMDDLKRHFRVPTRMTARLFYNPPGHDAFLGPPRCQNCLTASCARTSNETLSCDTCPKHGVQYLCKLNDAAHTNKHEFKEGTVVADHVEIVCIACSIRDWDWTATYVTNIKKSVTKTRSTLWCVSECSDKDNARPPYSGQLGDWKPNDNQKLRRAHAVLNHIQVIDQRDYKQERGDFGHRPTEERAAKRARITSPQGRRMH